MTIKKQYKFRTIVFIASSFVGNPVDYVVDGVIRLKFIVRGT